MNVQELMDKVFPTVKQNGMWYSEDRGGCTLVCLLLEGGSQVIKTKLDAGDSIWKGDVEEGLREVFGLSEADAKELTRLANEACCPTAKFQPVVREFLTTHTAA